MLYRNAQWLNPRGRLWWAENCEHNDAGRGRAGKHAGQPGVLLDLRQAAACRPTGQGSLVCMVLLLDGRGLRRKLGGVG